MTPEHPTATARATEGGAFPCAKGASASCSGTTPASLASDREAPDAVEVAGDGSSRPAEVSAPASVAGSVPQRAPHDAPAPARLSDAAADEIAARWQAATPGPWMVEERERTGNTANAPRVEVWSEYDALLFVCECGSADHATSRPDAEAIAAAPSDVAALLADRGALRRALNDVCAVLDGAGWNAIAGVREDTASRVARALSRLESVEAQNASLRAELARADEAAHLQATTLARAETEARALARRVADLESDVEKLRALWDEQYRRAEAAAVERDHLKRDLATMTQKRNGLASRNLAHDARQP